MQYRNTFLFLMLFYFSITRCFSQHTAELRGDIFDNGERALAGVSVVLKGVSVYTVVSGEKGDFVFHNIQPGEYRLYASRTGFANYEQKIRVKDKDQFIHIYLASQANELQSVEITGHRRKAYKLNETYIGSKGGMNIKDLPQSVSYATKELMLDQGDVRVGEVVKNFSGVNQFTSYDDLTIRGFRVNGQSNTQLLNGMRTSTGFWKQPLTNYLERVEVLKGPASALYGNASPGGVVNRVTKKPLNESRKNITLQMGSFNTFRVLTDFTGPVNKDSSLLYRLNLGYEDANTFRDLMFDKNIVVAPSVSFIPDANTRINVDLVYNASRSRLDRGQSLLANGDLNSTPQSLSLATPNDKLNENTYTITVAGSRKLGDNASFNVAYSRTGYNEDLYEHRGANAYAKDTMGKDVSNLVAMQIFARKRNRYIGNLTAYADFKINTGSIEHNWIAGYDYGSELSPAGASQLTASGYRNAANNAAITFNAAQYAQNPSAYIKRFLVKDGLLVPNVPSFNLNDVVNSQKMQDDSKAFFTNTTLAPTYYYLHAGYLQDRVRIGRLQLLLGIRYEHYTDFANYLATNQTKTNSTALLPRFGAVYTVSENINVYGTYVTGYNPQSAATLSNPSAGGPFEPLRSNMTEFGAKSSWLHNRLSASAAVYRIEQKNTLYNANNPNNPDSMMQIGKERSEGIEFDVTGQLTSSWSIMASYAYNDARILAGSDAEKNRQKPNAPRNLANLWTKYMIRKGPLSGLGAGLGVYYVGERGLSISLDQTIPAYTLVNAAVYYNFGQMQLQLNVNNATNKKHWVGGYDYIRLFPGNPRQYLITLNYAF
ncbi:TonB-dependent siderophore receptor [Filimonas effusa]|nr:TonB-dependent siderophore receptor [Filimonas effusa]